MHANQSIRGQMLPHISRSGVYIMVNSSGKLVTTQGHVTILFITAFYCYVKNCNRGIKWNHRFKLINLNNRCWIELSVNCIMMPQSPNVLHVGLQLEQAVNSHTKTWCYQTSNSHSWNVQRIIKILVIKDFNPIMGPRHAQISEFWPKTGLQYLKIISYLLIRHVICLKIREILVLCKKFILICWHHMSRKWVNDWRQQGNIYANVHSS